MNRYSEDEFEAYRARSYSGGFSPAHRRKLGIMRASESPPDMLTRQTTIETGRSRDISDVTVSERSSLDIPTISTPAEVWDINNPLSICG